MINDFLESGLNEIHLIVFRLGSEEYAVPITSVQEIIMLQTPTRIPKAPSFVEGVINLRGHIIPIIDGRKKFQLEISASTNESRIMIIELTNETIGLIVDAVSEVIHLNADDIEPPPIDMADDSDFLWGVGKFLDRLLILVDPQKFLNFSETSDLKTLSKVSKMLKETKESNIKEIPKESEVSIDEVKSEAVVEVPKAGKKVEKRKV
jgi:purine-binding chemotaxis protein CheW